MSVVRLGEDDMLEIDLSKTQIVYGSEEGERDSKKNTQGPKSLLKVKDQTDESSFKELALLDNM